MRAENTLVSDDSVPTRFQSLCQLFQVLTESERFEVASRSVVTAIPRLRLRVFRAVLSCGPGAAIIALARHRRGLADSQSIFSGCCCDVVVERQKDTKNGFDGWKTWFGLRHCE